MLSLISYLHSHMFDYVYIYIYVCDLNFLIPHLWIDVDFKQHHDQDFIYLFFSLIFPGLFLKKIMTCYSEVLQRSLSLIITDIAWSLVDFIWKEFVVTQVSIFRVQKPEIMYMYMYHLLGLVYRDQILMVGPEKVVLWYYVLNKSVMTHISKKLSLKYYWLSCDFLFSFSFFFFLKVMTREL